ncbi:MAG: type III polyketide synthase [Syntrophothermus sp.]
MIIDIVTANPPYQVSRQLAADKIKINMGNTPALNRLIDMAAANSGIDNRYVVMPDAFDNGEEKFFYKQDGSVYSPSTKERMGLYEKWSKILGDKALCGLLDNNKINAKEVDKIVTISCTGFYAPGVDNFLIDKFSLSKNIRREHIGFMGCSASIIGLTSAIEALRSPAINNVIIISQEISSIHLQYEPSRDNILSNMIFADGCAAVLLSKNENLKPKLDILSTKSILFKDSSEYMGWRIGNNGFQMILSSELPKIILGTAAPELINILKEWGVQKENIKHWALHPGGRAILDALQKGLSLTDEEMHPSREVLRNYGNMSSASILFVLKEILNTKKVSKDEFVCAVAFGPGLSMEVALLRGL